MHTFIIDDDDINVFLTKQALRSAGISGHISPFLSAETALSILKQDSFANTPDIIFLDLNMPIMNGWEFLEALQPYEQLLIGRCHIYILTSSLALSDMVRSKDYVLVDGLIHKPLNQVAIQTVLSQMAEKDQS